MDVGSEWLFSVPTVSRAYLIGIVITSLLTHFEFISPLQIYYNINSIVGKYEIWRFFTCFFYFGPITFDLLYHIFFLLKYSRALEEEYYNLNTGKFLRMLLSCAVCLLIISPIVRQTFLGTSLTLSLVYIWSKRNPMAMMNFLGFFNFNAQYLPWVLTSFAYFVNGVVPYADILGITCGHLVWLAEDVVPRYPLFRHYLRDVYFYHIVKPDRNKIPE